MADECGATLYPLTFWDAPPDGRFDAALYDWDLLPAHRRQEILLDSLAGFSSYPMAVHGYNLRGEEVETLHQEGVAVFDRLEPEVFQILRRLATPNTRSLQGKYRRRRNWSSAGHGRPTAPGGSFPGSSPKLARALEWRARCLQ
jgi:hypothetical protein